MTNAHDMREILATNQAQSPEKTQHAHRTASGQKACYISPRLKIHDEHAIFTHARRAGQNAQVPPQERDGSEREIKKVPDLDQGHDPAALLQHARARNRREPQV